MLCSNAKISMLLPRQFQPEALLSTILYIVVSGWLEIDL